MHPAPSVILFTTLSGLGFGMLAWMGFGFRDVTGLSAFIFYFVAYALAVGGLLASTFHLRQPKRALKAFTQWRSSWLSREAICSVAALCCMGLYAIGLIFFGTKLAPIGWIGGILSLGTVFTTSMIYTQMKTIPRWHMPATPVLFLLYAITGGALLTGNISIAIVLLLVLSAAQFIGWLLGDRRLKESGTTIETATGLGQLGKVRQLEPPHTGTNYLLKEMVFVVARKHATKLRSIALVLLGIAPAVILYLLPTNHFIGLIAVLAHLAGVFTSRWLFFAEAEHVVGLYYDKR